MGRRSRIFSPSKSSSRAQSFSLPAAEPLFRRGRSSVSLFALAAVVAVPGIGILPGHGAQAAACIPSCNIVSVVQGDAGLDGASGGAGDSGFTTMGAAGVIGWGFGLGDAAKLTPFLGIAATKSERWSYEDSGKFGVVGDPVSYSSYAASQVTGLAGARLEGLVGDRLGYRLGAALEHDFSYDLDPFKVSGAFGSSSYESSEAPADWRLGGNAGVSYFLSPNHELTLDGYASTFREDTMDYAVSVGFKFGL